MRSCWCTVVGYCFFFFEVSAFPRNTAPSHRDSVLSKDSVVSKFLHYFLHRIDRAYHYSIPRSCNMLALLRWAMALFAKPASPSMHQSASCGGRQTAFLGSSEQRSSSVECFVSRDVQTPRVARRGLCAVSTARPGLAARIHPCAGGQTEGEARRTRSGQVGATVFATRDSDF